MKKTLFIGLSVCAQMILTGCSQDPASQPGSGDGESSNKTGPVTQLYVNAEIVTMDDTNPTAEAVAVSNGKIIGVGERAVLEEQIDGIVEINDIQGQTLLPGLIDAHGHISYTSLNLASANVSSPPVGTATTIADVIDLLIIQRDKTPADGWVIGWGYDDSLLEEKRHPTRADLDKVSTERPVAIRHVSGHFVSCNSACLAVAGIDADMPDPAGGIIRRLGDSSEPDGVLEESAMAPLFAAFPRPDKQQRMALLTAAQKYYASYGVTTVQDGAAQIDEVDLMREYADQGSLFLDVVAYPYALYFEDRLTEYPASNEYDKRFRIGGFKLVLDGSPQGKTAWLTEPYLHPPHGQEEGYSGYATLKDEQVQSYIEQAFKSNTQVLAHANGDAAADQLINAVKAGNVVHGKADRRTVMIHAQTAREDQIVAMIEEDIIPSYFSAHTFYWGDWHRDSVFGVERASRISPLRSSADKGLRYTTHNDTPIVPPDMMRLLWASVNRITRSNQVLGEEQRATPMEALKSITIDAAYQYFEEDKKGSISVGKIADFVVLDKNPLTVPHDQIKDIVVLQTIKDGETVFSR